MRTPKPWYRRQTDTWYVCLRGKQVPLAKGKRSKREAEEAFHRLMALSAIECGPPLQAAKVLDGRSLEVVVLLDQFLNWVQQNLDCYE